MAITIIRSDFADNAMQVQLDLHVPESYYNKQKLAQKGAHIERSDEFFMKVVVNTVFDEEQFPDLVSPMSERGMIATYVYDKLMQKSDLLQFIASRRMAMVTTMQSVHAAEQLTEILNEIDAALRAINDTFSFRHGPKFPVDADTEPKLFDYSNHPDFVMYG